MRIAWTLAMLCGLAFGATSACGSTNVSGDSGGAPGGGTGGSTTGGTGGSTTGGTGGSTTGGTGGVSDAGGEYIDDAGECRTDFVSGMFNCPDSLDQSALCAMCSSSMRVGSCTNLVEYSNSCTPSRSCWYDTKSQKLVGARYCDDVASACGNTKYCVVAGDTTDCSPSVNPCLADAGTD